jgi:hypothetical protein
MPVGAVSRSSAGSKKFCTRESLPGAFRLSGLQWKADEIRDLLRPFHDDGGTWDPPRSPLRVVK